VMRLILLFISYYKCMNIWKIIRETEIQYVTVHCSYKGRMLLNLIDLRVAAKIRDALSENICYHSMKSCSPHTSMSVHVWQY
jgi:hypothetical protein